MAKACLAAELVIVIFSTTITIRSLFSWINMRINKEELQDFIRENVQNDIIQAINPQVWKRWSTGFYYFQQCFRRLKDGWLMVVIMN